MFDRALYRTGREREFGEGSQSFLIDFCKSFTGGSYSRFCKRGYKRLESFLEGL